jgi:hypothetical protein
MVHTVDSGLKDGRVDQFLAAESKIDLKQSIETIRKMKNKSKRRRMKNNRDILNEINQSGLMDDNAELGLKDISFAADLTFRSLQAQSSEGSQSPYTDSEGENSSLDEDESQSEMSDAEDVDFIGGDNIFQPKQQSSRRNSKNDQAKEKDPIHEFKINFQPSRSIFRRRNYRFLKSEPKKVYFQIVIQQGSDMERTSVFEVNIDI